MNKKKRVKAKTAPRVKRTKKLSLFVIVPLILVSLFVVAATIYKIVEVVIVNISSTNLPKLEIFLAEVPIEQIDADSKNVKYPHNTAILTTNGDSTTYKNVEIKGRGNGTWAQIKKPYQIKFDHKENLFNLGEDKKWVLLANYLDPTSLRTDTAFYLEKLFDEKYSPQGSFIEFYIDNSYHGLYYLTEKLEIGKSRIDLADPSNILVEIDNLYGAADGCYSDKNKNCFVVKDSVNPDNEKNNMQEFLNIFNLLMTEIEQKNYENIEKLIDIDSFAKYFLVNEFTANPDAYSTSFFMYLDKGKIYAGPGWDFDSAFGNKSWVTVGINTDLLYSPFETMFLKNYLDKSEETPHTISIVPILYGLMEIPEFSQRVKEIYQETLSGRGDELLEYIKSQAEYIRPAASKDQERWKLKTNFDEEVDYLIDWVAKRYDYFEQTYGISSNQAPESPQPSLEF